MSEPRGGLHDHLACRSCDGAGLMRVEVIYNGDDSYEDVRDCDQCDGTGLRCSCPPGPVTWETRAMDCMIHGEGVPFEYVVAGDDIPF